MTSAMIDLAELKEMAVANEVDISQRKLMSIISEIETLRAKLEKAESGLKSITLVAFQAQEMAKEIAAKIDKTKTIIDVVQILSGMSIQSTE